MISDEKLKELKKIATQLRITILKMIGVGKAGHLGGAGSLVEVITTLYFQTMKIDKDNPQWVERDRFVLSKGHSVLTQYAALNKLGYFPESEIYKVKAIDGLLQGHPDMAIPGIEAVTGSLGQGLSIGLGMALALKLDKKDSRVYVIMGDGEMSEGQIWEAAMSSSIYKVDNLTAFIDVNKMQATGFISDVFDITKLREKWETFGWNVLECDGHKFEDLIKTIEETRKIKNQPSVILLHTIKGKGFGFAENNPSFHNGILTVDQYETLLADLESQLERI